MGKKRRRTDEDTEFDLSKKTKEVKDDNEKRLIVILENAQLETVKVTYPSPPPPFDVYVYRVFIIIVTVSRRVRYRWAKLSNC